MLKKGLGILILLIFLGCTVSYIVVKKSSDVDIEVKEDATSDLKSNSGISVKKRDSTDTRFK